MDRPRLRRYQQKDYTQRVEFPVEIVGRDNHVRRYAFDDAVRLYQRRIDTAPARYADPETIDAEVRHCRLRIEQLRRSYIEGAGGARPAGGQGLLAGPMAADLLFFLRRVYAEAGEAVAATLVPLETAGVEAWWCQGAQGRPSAILYAFRLDGEGPPGAGQALEGVLSRLRAAEREPAAERLYAGVIGRDLALLLAGTEGWDGPKGLLTEAQPAEAPDVGGGDPWRAAMVALQEGQTHAALRQLEAALDADPHRRVLARAAALVALMADEPARAEFAARFGMAAGDDDRGLRYLLALAMARQGRAADALAAPMPGATGSLAMLRALYLVGEGRLAAAVGEARRARLGVAESEWFVPRVARATMTSAVSQLVVRGSAAAGIVAAAFVATAGQDVFGALATVGFVGLAWLGERRTRQGAQRALTTGRFGRVRLAPPELLPREGEAPRH